ncbi:MAG: acetate kinase [Acutalibacteraceae bacterium]|nr:acetate kinase [Acutalibacteraceae bacterium]
MMILVINAGSSSLKYQLFDMDHEKVLCKGNCERIGLDKSVIGHKTSDGKQIEKEVAMQNHKDAFMQVNEILTDAEYGVIKNASEITAVGHRVVQGGARFSKSELVTPEVIQGIRDLIPLAPLHNAGHVQAIEACLEVFGDKIPQVVVFDTAFHSTMPPKAYIYPLPYEYYEKYHIRRYGFHGTSHRYVSNRYAEITGKSLEGTKIISCHLGNGSSITAIENGKVIDTSMGLTPLDGFMMGTRCGTLDPSVVTYIEEKEGLTPQQMSDILNKKSGLLGISGISSDDRDVTKAADEGNERAILAHDILQYEIKKFIGGYYVALGGCDAMIFTAGLGENQAHHREAICEQLACFGVKIDKEINNQTVGGKEAKISTDDSKIDVYVIPTNEELVIARDTQEIVNNMN